MTRDWMIQRICELHEQAKQGEFGVLLINREQLDKQLDKMDDNTLAAAKRLLEGLLS